MVPPTHLELFLIKGVVKREELLQIIRSHNPRKIQFYLWPVTCPALESEYTLHHRSCPPWKTFSIPSSNTHCHALPKYRHFSIFPSSWHRKRLSRWYIFRPVCCPTVNRSPSRWFIFQIHPPTHLSPISNYWHGFHWPSLCVNSTPYRSPFRSTSHLSIIAKAVLNWFHGKEVRPRKGRWCDDDVVIEQPSKLSPHFLCLVPPLLRDRAQEW